MKPDEYIDPQLTFPDLVVLRNLLQDVDNGKVSKRPSSHEVVTDEDFLQQAGDSGYESQEPLDYEVQTDSSAEPQLRNRSKCEVSCPGVLLNSLINRLTPNADALPQQVPLKYDDQDTIDHLKALNDPKDAQFDPTVFVSWDLTDIKNRVFQEYILQPYIKWGKSIVRTETDIVMLTHLILYFITSVPSALFLFYRFSWTHGALHWLMQSWYVGTYTLMMHQHIHMSGILSPKYSWFDKLFPYITDPLMGHTWNSYFYHHVKHHHLEGNGPDDLSSTIRYQRDDLFHFLYYVGRFLFLVWFDLPLYFIGKGKAMTALKLAVSDMANYTCIYLLAAHVNFRATLFTLILPLTLLRLGLMVGNWGQHAFVDEAEPDSDFRSSITLIDVAVSAP